jgi:hypothetical protein
MSRSRDSFSPGDMESHVGTSVRGCNSFGIGGYPMAKRGWRWPEALRSRATFAADKCIFNLVPCHNEFEKEFAQFLQKAPDVQRFANRQRAYIEFILKLANATPIHGYAWLHGVKGGRMVHVSAVDAPVSVGDVTQIAAEFKRAVGTGKDAPKTNGVDVLELCR